MDKKYLTYLCKQSVTLMNLKGKKIAIGLINKL